MRRFWCQRLAHVMMTSSSVFAFWFLIECGSSASLITAVRMASKASCFALLKLTKAMDLGSQSSLIFTLGCRSTIAPIFSKHSRETGCSSCGLVSVALVMAKLEGDAMRILRWGVDCWGGRKSVTMSNAVRMEQSTVSLVVTVSPNTRSLCRHSQPFW